MTVRWLGLALGRTGNYYGSTYVRGPAYILHTRYELVTLQLTHDSGSGRTAQSLCRCCITGVSDHARSNIKVRLGGLGAD